MEKPVVHNKLVRDKIPEIIAATGKRCTTQVLSREAYLQALEEKLTEELEEYRQSRELEELADLLEVLQALVSARGDSWEALVRLCEEKRRQRGGFAAGIFLEAVWD